MWRRNDGFFLADLLLSLSAWLVIATVIFPLIFRSVNQSVQLKQEFAGTVLLYEYLQQAKINGRAPVNQTVEKDNSVYVIYSQSGAGAGEAEVCVKYEDRFSRTQEKCETYE